MWGRGQKRNQDFNVSGIGRKLNDCLFVITKQQTEHIIKN